MSARSAGRRALEWLFARPLAVGLAVLLCVGLPATVLTWSAAGATEAAVLEDAAAEQARSATAAASTVAEVVRDFRTRLVTVADSRLMQVGATRGDQALLGTVLQEFRPLLPGTRTLHYVDQSGVVLAADPPGTPLPAIAMAAQAPLAIDPTGPALIVATAVRDGFGAQVGGLVATMALRDLLDAAELPDDAWLVEPAGRAVVRAGEGAALREPAVDPSAIVSAAPAGDLGWQVALSRPRAPLLAEISDLGAELLAFRLALAAGLGVIAYVVASIARDLVVERRELRATNQRLAIASRHKAEFLANVNHELRTPLSSILGFAELLRDRTALDERQARYVRNIRDAGGQLLGLVDDILDLAALETGTLELRRERVAIERVLSRPLEVARGIAESRDLRLETEPAPRAEILCDQARLEHALTLLLASACDATPAGGLVGVAVAVAGSDLTIALADGGPAVARERALRVFDVFGRIREGTSGASGPGLALARRLIELHGGAVVIDGGDGSGGVITVRLPGIVAAPPA